MLCLIRGRSRRSRERSIAAILRYIVWLNVFHIHTIATTDSHDLVSLSYSLSLLVGDLFSVVFYLEKKGRDGRGRAGWIDVHTNVYSSIYLYELEKSWCSSIPFTSEAFQFVWVGLRHVQKRCGRALSRLQCACCRYPIICRNGYGGKPQKDGISKKVRMNDDGSECGHS